MFLFRALPERLGLTREHEAQAYRRQHEPREPFRSALVRALRCETALLRRGWSLPFGTSLLLVARARPA